MTRVVAVDWSGATKDLAKKLWSAEVAPTGRTGHELVALESWPTREELVRHLLALGREDPDLLVGLDFALALPAWFAAERGLDAPTDLWRHVAEHGEAWLAECPPPFFGRRGSRRPEPDAARPILRRTERDLGERGLGHPKSVFQIGGPGAVGTGSLRGMPFLQRFVDAGWNVWPFVDANGPTLFETWPRLYTRGLVKSAPGARASWVDRELARLEPRHRILARGSDDALDAAATALGIAAALAEGERLETDLDAVDRAEGRIATLLAARHRAHDEDARRAEARRGARPASGVNALPPHVLRECDLGF